MDARSEVKSRPPRAYRSHRREEAARATRRHVVEAAASVFLRHGYAGATVRAIAVEAGVSVPTVELYFGTKARLLKAAIDDAITGDDAAVPVLERSWAADAVRAQNADEFFAIVGAVIAAAQLRSAGLVLAVFEGVAADPTLAELAAEMSTQRASTAAWLIDALIRTSPLRAGCSREEAVDTLWALMEPALFDRLVRRRHWTVRQYERWFAGAARRLLIADTPTSTPHQREET